MPFLAPEMQQVLAGILAAILWTYFQGGRMCFKKMKSDEIELLRSDCGSHCRFQIQWASNSFLGVAWERTDGVLMDIDMECSAVNMGRKKQTNSGFHPKLDSSWTELEFIWEKTSPRSRWIWNTSCFQMSLNLYCLDFYFWESIFGDNWVLDISLCWFGFKIL